MAERKRKKLSLKRKPISNKSLLFNAIGQRQESLQANVKDTENAIVNVSSDSETEDDFLRGNKLPRLNETSTCSDRTDLIEGNGHSVRPIHLKSGPLPSASTKPSQFLDVDEDLRKLRMMFLKLQTPKIDVRGLSDLPEIASKQVPDLNDHAKDSSPTVLSDLPPMCKWCLRRKPSDFSKLYDEVIQQELRTDRRESSLPKRNVNLSSIFSNPVHNVEERQMDKEFSSKLSQKSCLHLDNKDTYEKKYSSSQKQTANIDNKMAKVIQPPVGRITTHPVKISTGSVTRPGNEKTQHESSLELSSKKKAVPSIRKQHNNSREDVATVSRSGPTANHRDRSHVDRLIKPTVVNTEAPKLNTDMSSNEAQLLSSTTDTSELESGKLGVQVQMSDSHTVQCCPLCQTTFDKGATQIDIDGHIALCLSMSGDDATW